MKGRGSNFLFGLLLTITAQNGTAQVVRNWESPHVHPITLSADGSRLAAVNTIDNRVEVFAPGEAFMSHTASIAVGLDPVSVRFDPQGRLWVVNHISDSVSIIEPGSEVVSRTLATADEPADVVFAKSKAFVSCSQANAVLVFDLDNLDREPLTVAIGAEDPRAMAVSPDGTKVYVAIFESGNGSTILNGGDGLIGGQIVNSPLSPYGGVNPFPNDGDQFNPPIRESYLPGGEFPAPAVSLIVKQDDQGKYRDDNGTDWSEFVNGSQAGESGRPVGWTLHDRDIAIVDTQNLTVTYINRLMNAVMDIGLNPASGAITAVGTDGTNEVRFEPVLKGRFVRSLLAVAQPALTAGRTWDMNAGHLDYSDAQIQQQSNSDTASQALREMSIGDPRAIAWSKDGSRGFVAGMGSNNVVVMSINGRRTVDNPIKVGEGPTGLVLTPDSNRLYVLNRFEATISAIDTASLTESYRTAFFDPTPYTLRVGRRLLFDSHRTSALGQASCGSCHIDARMDRLAWDLGNPDGDMKLINEFPGQHNDTMDLPILSGGLQPFHPMKGPMVTQTMQDIIGKEPHHWRGDRDGIEEFNGAFTDLLGDDELLTDDEMQAFEDYLATIFYPPNPFRNIDNSLPTNLPLPGQFATGRFADDGGLGLGDPLPNGNAQNGLALYRPPNLLDLGVACVTCHSLPTGAGADVRLDESLLFVPIPPGPNGERHLALTGVDAQSNRTMKIPHLRNIHEKTGLDFMNSDAYSGFGYLNDGTFDTITRFISIGAFAVANDQEIADIVAFMFAFSGSDLPEGSDLGVDLEPPGPPSNDTHAAVGRQVTFRGDSGLDLRGAQPLLNRLVALSDKRVIGLVAKTVHDDEARGYTYLGSNEFQSDREAETISLDALLDRRSPEEALTFTAVVAGAQTRIGIDRDSDGAFDRDEIDACSNPADPTSLPSSEGCPFFADGFE